jgi:hypothetical protein
MCAHVRSATRSWPSRRFSSLLSMLCIRESVGCDARPFGVLACSGSSNGAGPPGSYSASPNGYKNCLHIERGTGFTVPYSMGQCASGMCQVPKRASQSGRWTA